MKVASILVLILFSIWIAIAAGEDFKAFMSKNKKSYSAAEKKKREANFNKNVEKIKKKNALAAKNKHSYKFAINKLADMDQDEIEKKYMGLKLLPLSAHRRMATTKKTTTTKTTKTTTKKTTTTKTTTTKTTKTTTKKTTTTKTTTTKTTTTKSTTTKPTTATTTTTTTTKPTTTTTKTTTTTPTTTTTKTTTTAASTGFDWTAQPGKVAAIKDQGGCGSCWAFATATVVETYWARKGNSLTEFSEQMLVDCENTSFGCDGGYPYYALMWERENGTMTEAAYSYSSGDSGVEQTCGFNKASVVAKIGSFSWTTSEATIFSLLQSNGPFLISMAANNLDFYSSGVLMASACTDPAVNHAVVVVGYGTSGGVDFWKIRNSWGTWWGEDGYFRLERNKNACKMVSYSAYYITA